MSGHWKTCLAVIKLSRPSVELGRCPAIGALHDTLCGQCESDRRPTEFPSTEFADQRKNGLDERGRARVTMRVTGVGARRLGGRAILCEAFGIDLHIREVGIAIQKCQRANVA